MNSNIEFDELFALRILHQDDFEDESDIIRELKYDLIQKGIPVENIPNNLKNFYEAFGINITLEQINEALQPSEEENMTNQLINAVNQLLNVQVQQNINGEEYNDEDDGDDNDGGDEDIVDDSVSTGSEDDDIHQDISSNVVDASGNSIINPLQSGGSNIQFYLSPTGPGGQMQYTFTNGNLPPGTSNLSLNSLLGSLLNSNPSMILPPLPPQQMMLQPLLSPMTFHPYFNGHRIFF